MMTFQAMILDDYENGDNSLEKKEILSSDEFSRLLKKTGIRSISANAKSTREYPLGNKPLSTDEFVRLKQSFKKCS